VSHRAFVLAAVGLIISACATHTVAPSTSTSTHPVALTYLGVAGWKLDDGAHTLLVDPYFSRLAVETASLPLTPNRAVIAQYGPVHADAILVGHSHYDHLLDVPDLAKRTGATVVGTESTCNVARAAGVPEEHLVPARGQETFQLGPFSVHAVRGLHSLTGVPDAAIPRDVTMPMSADAYAEGGTLQYLVRVEGHAILFIGTASFIESEIEGLRPDVAVIATRLREKVPDYSCRLMKVLGHPRLVLTNHFDAHWNPLGPKQMQIEDADRADLMRFAEEIHGCSPETKVIVPTHLQPISI
jgi:L-ascorbate metabolism protein UlaG (beta-lactamase superfamily)